MTNTPRNRLGKLFESGLILELTDLLDNCKLTSDDMNTGLEIAVTHGHTGTVELLFSYGADVRAKDDHALRVAVKNGYIHLVKFLIVCGADICSKDDLVPEAAANGHLEVVKYLVERGANLHGGEGTALGEAVRAGHLKVVEYLVNHGAI